MKNIVLMILMLIGFTTFSQQKEKLQTVTIQTSAQCGDCKERIENALNYTKGIKYAELNLEDSKVEVKFNPDKITLEAIKKVINEIGYDADEMKATKEKVEQLPTCCRPGGMD